MKKIYFIYATIPEKTFNMMKYIISNAHSYRWKNGKMFGLYAWTTSKSIASEFFEVRNKSVYTLVKKEVDEYEYKSLKEHYGVLKLDYRIYSLNGEIDDINDVDEDKYIEIISTKDEHTSVTMDGEENLYEFGPPIEKSVHYNLFKTKIIRALDILGYTKNYNLKYGTDVDVDNTSFQSSFGLTPYGQRDKIIHNNQMNVLLYLYQYMFYGETRI